MKILIICNCATGLEVFRGMLIQKLVKERNVVSAIVPQTNDKKETDAEDGLKKMHCNLIRIPIERRGMNPFRDIQLLLEYYRTVKEIKPELVITYTIKPNIYGGLVCRLLKIPYAANITGLGTAFQDKGMLCHLVTRMYKVALKKAKVVFFENVENRDVIVNAKIIPKNQTYVLAGAGVDLEHFYYIEYPEETNMTKFLFIGRVMREKGIDELFSAMERLNNEGYKCSLDVVGEFEENYSEKIKKCEDDGWLNYRGYQSDVRPFIAKSHCFVLPSWHEGMANTNLECAASGRPVITSNIHGCLEAIIEGKTGFLVDVKNSNDLYETMKRFMELSYKEKKAMGIAGRAHMINIFDKKKVVGETVNYLNKFDLEYGRGQLIVK